MNTTTLLLILKIMNTAHVESGKKVACIFNKNGGAIGSGANNLWIIQDNKANLFDSHARIEWIDGGYCIQAIGKARLLINKAEFVSKSGFIRLKKGDLIEIGNLSIRAHIGTESEIDMNALSLKPEDIIGNTTDYLQDLIGSDKRYKATLQLQDSHTVDGKQKLDPLLILNEGNKITTLEDDVSSHIVLDTKTKNLVHEGPRVNQHNYIDLPTPNSNVEHDFLETSFVTISPLMREMDISIPLSNSQEANDFLSEIGKTLKATVKGLLALQQAQSSLSDKHLRPIEDNPLRLNLEYVPTMDVLFGDQKSPVHLAAPAAVSESLNNLLIHNEANRIAITSALTAILDAFSPKVLLTRFESYRRTSEIRDADNSWAWEMYGNYYNELTSKRQHGFEKLFWEVYSQAYDKALRELQVKQDL